MLFNSYIFILAFLPAVLLIYYAIQYYRGRDDGMLFLIAASLVFYGWWNPKYLWLLLFTIIVNFYLGRLLRYRKIKSLLIFSVAVNLLLLGYFKYSYFILDGVNGVLGSNIDAGDILLPLAISFFTFQQITFLVDSYKNDVGDYSFSHYCLFVTFFPQLIAGPIVHHKQMLPQFMSGNPFAKINRNIAIGLSIFILGLFKKVILADNIALHASPVFGAAEQGVELTIFEAWGGAIAYSLQLYFDFSGYSDMAIGIARMFGIVLPINFYSPYKATSIIDFWQRWHISLSNFLKDYLYIPLGGNRHGMISRYKNLMLTMLLGGLWHGAGLNFVLWGGVHGLLLVLNHGWNRYFGSTIRRIRYETFMGGMIKGISILITFLLVTVAWVLFRSESMDGAEMMLQSMIGANGVSLPPSFKPILNSVIYHISFVDFSYEGMFHNGVFGEAKTGIVMVVLGLAIVWLMPNTVDLFNHERVVIESEKYRQTGGLTMKWHATIVNAILLSMVAAVCLVMLGKPSEFLYFQF